MVWGRGVSHGRRQFVHLSVKKRKSSFPKGGRSSKKATAQHKWGVLNQLELAKRVQEARQVAIGVRLASQFPIQLDQGGHPKAPVGCVNLQ